MEKIRDKDITVTCHAVDGFTLSYITDEGDCCHKRYIGYGVREAKRRFKEYVYEEDSKIFRCMTRYDMAL
jgi:adenosine deaminase